MLLYAGDFDSSGEDIDRDFVERTGCFDQVVRVALDWSQVQHFNLPPAPGKTTDSRAAAFTARHGRLVQVELEAFDPNELTPVVRAGTHAVVGRVRVRAFPGAGAWRRCFVRSLASR